MNRDAHYVLTRIDNAIRTFQLTPAGESKLATAGILPGHRFERAILFDLFRSGDAFTRGSEGEIADSVLASQFKMDFENDPDPETAFPVCDGCQSVVELQLIFTGSGAGLSARLQCPDEGPPVCSPFLRRQTVVPSDNEPLDAPYPECRPDRQHRKRKRPPNRALNRRDCLDRERREQEAK